MRRGVRTFATLRVRPAGLPAEVAPGGMIGRGPGSSLAIPLGSVHEAHALVSYRQGALVALPARGGLWQAGEARRMIELQPRVSFDLDAEGRVSVEVVGVVNFGFAVEVALGDGRARVLRPGFYYHVDPRGGARWLRTDGPSTGLALWMAGSDWFFELAGRMAEPLQTDTTYELPGGHTLEVRTVNLDVAATLGVEGLALPAPGAILFTVTPVGEGFAVAAAGVAPLRGDAADLLVELLTQWARVGRDLQEKEDIWRKLKGAGMTFHSGRFSKLVGEVNDWLATAAPGRRVDASGPGTVRLVRFMPEDRVHFAR